jgi:hypothetical protein
MEQADRRVANTERNGTRVSTAFLGVDHASFGMLGRGAKPLLFETLVFGGPHNGFTERCSTWAEAEDQHRRICDQALGQD